MGNRSTIAVGIAAFLAAGCGGAGSGTELGNSGLGAGDGMSAARATKSLRETAGQVLVRANNEFGFRVFQLLAAKKPSGNVFVSPASIASALHMAYGGAAGATREAMAKAMGITRMDQAEVNAANRDLYLLLQNIDPKVQLTVANSLWARAGVEFEQGFLSRNEQFFGAEVTTIDFDTPDALAAINGWVSRKTSGRIESIVDQIDGDTVMYLINAVHFKGLWKEPFDKEKTADAQFRVSEKEAVAHPMMNARGSFRYLAGSGFKAVALPYAQGRVGMYVFLPDDADGLAAFLESLSSKNWEAWMAGFKPMQGDVSLPRFKVEYESMLNDALKATGMGVAFEPDRADFSGMRSQRDLYLQWVRHKAFVEVNEEGTEAAATTGVAVGVTSMPETFRFVADRPFFYAIRDNETGLVLFAGVLADPR